MIKTSKTKWIISLATVGALAIGGTAFAYWTAAGAGVGAAQTSTIVPVVVNQTTPVVGLAPGLAAQPLSGTFTNPNTSPVYVAGVTAAVTGTGVSGCDASDYIIAGTATVNAEVAPGVNKGSWSGLTIQFNNKATNQDACKLAVVAIGLTSN